jgi:hypothetical protein
MVERMKRERFVTKHLDPASRMGEVLFGLIMVLSITLIVGINGAEGEQGIHELLYAAIGCNVAWGIIDAVMYVMSCITQRGERTRLILAIREAPDRDKALDTIQEAIEYDVAELTNPDDREALYGAIYRHLSGAEPVTPWMKKEDLLGALASFWLVFMTCFPAVIPFLLVTDPHVALRISNTLLLAMLFMVGVIWGDYVKAQRIVSGAAMLAIGLGLVGVAVLLGG